MLLIKNADELILDRKFHVDQLHSVLMFCKEKTKSLETGFGIS
jgi:hypothetical protein